MSFNSMLVESSRG
uniref:Uncharacterized protein n=1 Tax=Rhizophora mucronata TaxID=61149 RepID=A0A2P2NV08_RHIMU